MLALAPSQDLTAAEQFAMDLLVDLSRVVPFTGEADVVRVGVVGTHGVLPHVIQIAESHGINVTDLSVKVPTLETVFIRLTGSELRE